MSSLITCLTIDEGLSLSDLLTRLDSTEFGHLGAIRKENFARKFKNILWLQRITEIECREVGVSTQTEEDRVLYVRGLAKFVNTGRKQKTDANPHLASLKEAWIQVRTDFPTMSLVSHQGRHGLAHGGH